MHYANRRRDTLGPDCSDYPQERDVGIGKNPPPHVIDSSHGCEFSAVLPANGILMFGVSCEERHSEDNPVLERDGVALMADPLSLQYLGGAESDYRDSLSDAQFVIRNPTARTTCGFRSSFAV